MWAGELKHARVYSTAAFRSINDPLRDLGRQQRREPHPLPLTVALLAAAVGKLRAVGAEEAEANRRMELYRGMRGVEAEAGFLEAGGTELAPMSTTSDLAVALRYAAGDSSASSLLFRIHTRSSMERGADISFLSAFPAEREFLYPPLLYLQPTAEVSARAASGRADEVMTVTVCGRSYRVIEVEPRL